MNKNFILIMLGIALLIAIVVFAVKKDNATNMPSEVVITQYETGKMVVLKQKIIDLDIEIKELSGYVKDLKPLKSSEMVDLAIINQIRIQYNDNIYVGIQLGEKDYCYYANKEKNISSLSKMPNGLYEWVCEKLK